MTRHQLRLHGSEKQRERVDAAVADRFVRKEISIREALDIGEEHVAGLRAQARALYDSARWERCADVVCAIAALGDIEPWDAVMAARAYQELGDARNAAIWAGAAEQMLAELEVIVRTARAERAERGETR